MIIITHPKQNSVTFDSIHHADINKAIPEEFLQHYSVEEMSAHLHWGWALQVGDYIISQAEQGVLVV